MSVEVKLELGHRASLREKPTSEGFTHDWTVFVKGGEGSNIYHFVEKVVFHLHDSFPKPKRVVKEPPYQVSESGYAGFIMPIEVYFRSKEEPKKVCFEYDLFLRLEGSPVYNLRLEKLTFQNPSDDFRRKLLKARTDKAPLSTAAGVPIQNPSTTPTQNTEEQRQQSYSKPALIAEKKPRSHTTGKDSSKATTPSHKTSHLISESTSSSLNKLRISPDPTNIEENLTSSQSPNKKLHTVEIAPIKETKLISKEILSSDSKETKLKSSKPDKDTKSGVKRSLFDESNHHCSAEKKKRCASLNRGQEAVIDSHKLKDSKDKKEKHKSKSSISNKKEKHKLSTSFHTKDVSSKSPKVNNGRSISPSNLLNDTDSSPKQSIHKVEETISPNFSEAPCEKFPLSGSDAEDDQNSSLSSDESSPLYIAKESSKNNIHETSKSSVEKSKAPSKLAPSSAKIAAVKSKSLSKPHRSRHNSKENHETLSEKLSPTCPLYSKELIELQHRIMSLGDNKLLQRIVNVIEKTGKFHVTTSSFDFDLCSLDYNTVRKLKNTLSM